MLPRRFGVLLAAVPLVAVLLADAGLLARRSTPEPGKDTSGKTVSSSEASRGVDEAARAREAHVLGRLVATGRLSRTQAARAYRLPLRLVGGHPGACISPSAR